MHSEYLIDTHSTKYKSSLGNSNHNAQTTTYEAENHYNKLLNTPQKILDAKKQRTQDSHYETFSSIDTTANTTQEENPYEHYETFSSITNQSMQNTLTPKELDSIYSKVIKKPNAAYYENADSLEDQENHYENADFLTKANDTKFQDMLKQQKNNQTEVSGPG